MAEQRTEATEAVHMGVRNPTTGRIGIHSTPTGEIHTACLAGWPEGMRPKRTLRWDRVTCSSCLAAIEARDPRVELKERAALDSKRLSWLGADDERLLDVRGYLQNEGGTIREAIDVLRVRQGT